MKKIIFLSDLHIGRRRKETLNTKKIFAKIAKSYTSAPVIITGDLTNSAKRGQFIETRKLIDKLARTNPVLMVPGNHDYAWEGNIWQPEAWAIWVKYLGSPLGWGRKQVPWMGVDYEPKGIDGLGIWKDGECVYFGIDSGDPRDKVVSARGYISTELAGALATSLKEYTGKIRIAVLHHHPFTSGLFTALSGSKILLEALKNNCELVLFGHEHEYGIWWNERGVPLIVSSHKSTKPVTSDYLMFTVIEIGKAVTPNVSFRHCLEVV